MDKPRILFITPLPPPVHGSAMVSRFIKDSTLINESFQTDFVNLSTSRQTNEIGQKSMRKFFRFVGSYFKVFSKLFLHRYDICYLAITCHGIGFLKDVPFVLLCKLFGSKVVIHQHNKGMSGYVDCFPYNKLLPLAYRHTYVILLSWKLYSDIESVVGKEQVRICPNGIPESFVPVKTDMDYSKVPQLLFLSNLVESKGIFILLDACKMLKKKGYRFVCHCVGGESKEITRDVFENEIYKRGLVETVFYHGPQYGKDKETFFRKADIFVQPTFEDCFPLTIVEAMQHSLPVVATDEGAIADMIVDGESGYICKRKDVCCLAKSLEKLLISKDLRQQMGKNACCRYKERYTMKAFEKNLQYILSDLLN